MDERRRIVSVIGILLLGGVGAYSYRKPAEEQAAVSAGAVTSLVDRAPITAPPAQRKELPAEFRLPRASAEAARKSTPERDWPLRNDPLPNLAPRYAAGVGTNDSTARDAPQAALAEDRTFRAGRPSDGASAAADNASNAATGGSSIQETNVGPNGRPNVGVNSGSRVGMFANSETTNGPDLTRPTARSISPAPTVAEPEFDAGPRVRTHTIRDGDTLSALAERYLGSAQRYHELYEANLDVLRRPDLLPIGAALRIPAASQTATQHSAAPGERNELVPVGPMRRAPRR